MIITYGSKVVKINGEKAGEVKYVVMDPKEKELTHIIVEKGFLFKEDRVLPISLVSDSNEEQVSLYKLEEPLDDLPVFKEDHYVEVDLPSATKQKVAGPAILYDYPPVGTSPQPVTDERLTKTPNYRAIHGDAEPIQKGAQVISLDGEHLGNIEKVVVDPRTDQVTHFVITKGTVLIEEKSIPASWIDEIDENEIQLSVDQGVVKNLPGYKKDEKLDI